MDEWYFYSPRRGQFGPLSLERLKSLRKTFSDDDELFVWREGYTDWRPIHEVDEVTQLFLSPPIDLRPGPEHRHYASRKQETNAIGACLGALSSWISRRRKSHTGESLNPSENVVASKGEVRTGYMKFNFVSMHWHGLFSLGVSYWVVGFLGTIIFSSAILVIHSLFSSPGGYDPTKIFLTLSLFWCAFLLVSIWQYVGIWRSANRRINELARLGKNAPWAGIAKIAVVFSWLALAGTLGREGAPQVSEAYRMAFQDDPDIPAYSIRVMRNGTEAEITGGLKYGLTADLSRVFSASPQIRVLHLNSVGGRIGEAEKLYAFIRKHGLNTYVSSSCESACTLAFAAGRQRWIHQRAALGFHAPHFPGIDEDSLRASVRSQRKFFEAAGFDSQFIVRALGTPNSNMWRPSTAELLRARAVTNLSTGAEFAASGYGAHRSREYMASALARAIPALRVVQTRSPNVYETIVEAVHQSYVQGRTEAALLEALRTKLSAIIARNRAKADDGVLVDLGHLLLDQYVELEKRSPTVCYEYAVSDKAKVAAYLSPELVKRELTIQEQILRTAKERPKLDAKIVEATWDKAAARLEKKYGSNVAVLLAKEEVAASLHADYCSGSIALFKTILELEPNESAILLRDIMSRL